MHGSPDTHDLWAITHQYCRRQLTVMISQTHAVRLKPACGQWSETQEDPAALKAVSGVLC